MSSYSPTPQGDPLLEFVKSINDSSKRIADDVSDLKSVVSSVVVRVDKMEEVQKVSRDHKWNWWNTAISVGLFLSTALAAFAAMARH